MKPLKKIPSLLPLAVFTGAVGSLCRWGLYALAVDERGLLLRGHGLSWLLAVIVLGGVGVIAAGVRQEEAPSRQEDFGPCAAGTGYFALAAGITMTVLLPASAPETLAYVWQLLGLLAAVGLTMSGLCRIRGRQPGFLVFLLPCLFLLAHLVSHYRLWSAQPQIQDYLFDLLSTVALMLFAYYHAAAITGNGSPRLLRLFGLLAVTLGLVSLSRTEHLWLSLGGILFAAANLGSPADIKEATP